MARSADEVLGVPAYAKLEQIDAAIDTVTLYVSPAHLDAVLPGILAKKPRRVIFNPGTESSAHRDQLETAGIQCEEACTLVLLKTGQF